MAQNEANGVGDANSAPSATYPPVYHTLLPMAHGFNNDHTIFQSPQQPGFDAEDADAEEVLPQLEEEVVAEVESLTNNNSVFDSTITQNSPLSDADNEDILQELEEVVAAAAIHSVADDQSTDNSTTTQNPQITDTDAANIPPGLQEAVTASTADSLGYPSMSIEQLQGTALALTAHINAIVTAHSDPTDDQPAIPAPMLTLAEALDPMFFAMWNPAGAQHVHRYTGRISLTPSREEVVAFIEGLEKVDAESLESDSKECGICRGPYGEPVSMNACMPESPVKLPCSHVFGVECLTLLLSPKPEGWGHSLCPLCRVRVEVPRIAVREPPTAKSPEDANSVPTEIDL